MPAPARRGQRRARFRTRRRSDDTPRAHAEWVRDLASTVAFGEPTEGATIAAVRLGIGQAAMCWIDLSTSYAAEESLLTRWPLRSTRSRLRRTPNWWGARGTSPSPLTTRRGR